MELRQLAEMTAFEVDALDRDRTAILLSISPIEEHGPHLPLSTDLIEAQGVGRRLLARLGAERPDWTFVEYPPIPLGAGCFPYPGTANVRASVIRGAVTDIALAYAREGFRFFFVTSHHGGPQHNLALEAAVRTLRRRTPARMLALSGRVLIELFFQRGLHPLYAARGIPKAQWADFDVDVHAGALETSELLALRPDLVDPVYAELEPVLVPLDRLTPGAARTAGRGLGYFGAPARASAELGDAFLDAVVERVLPEARRFLAGQHVPGLTWRWRQFLRFAAALAWARARLAPKPLPGQRLPPVRVTPPHTIP
jgi:creatinine amidohydrolase